MKIMLLNWVPWIGGSLFAISGALEVRVVSNMNLAQFSGPGYLAAGFGLAWIAFAVGRRVPITHRRERIRPPGRGRPAGPWPYRSYRRRL